MNPDSNPRYIRIPNTVLNQSATKKQENSRDLKNSLVSI